MGIFVDPTYRAGMAESVAQLRKNMQIVMAFERGKLLPCPYRQPRERPTVAYHYNQNTQSVEAKDVGPADALRRTSVPLTATELRRNNAGYVAATMKRWED